jgi:hypothetical protein
MNTRPGDVPVGIGRHGAGNVPGVNVVLMDLVVRLAATLDELAGLDDRYERELLKMLEYVAGELDKLNTDERNEFAAHVEAMSASAATDPLASTELRKFLDEFSAGFGLIDEFE